MQNTATLYAIYEAKLTENSLRNTHVRKQLFDVLLDSEAPLTIQQLVRSINDAHYVSIYRSVDALHKADIIKLVPQGFKNLFELSDLFKPHHHHATCEKCGKSSAIHDPKLEQLMAELSANEGLRPTKHTFELFGVCMSCRQS